MTKVLFLTQVLPHPLDSGAKIRAYYVLRHLAQDHHVTLVSFVRPDDPAESVAHLASFCQAVHVVPMRRSPIRDARALLKSALTGRPVIIARDEIAAMRATLSRLVSEPDFDVIHADQTSMAQYGLYAARVARHGETAPYLVLDAHNALYRIPERMARYEMNPLKRFLLRREARLLRRYERAVYSRFDHVVFVTAVDRRELLGEPASTSQLLCARRQAPRPQPQERDRESRTRDRCPAGFRAWTIPICVDPEKKPLVERVDYPDRVTHLGTMFWPPNVEGVLWFAREVWPRVVDSVPDAQLSVIGKDPPTEVRKLGTLVGGIDVTGYVPDPVPYLMETAAFIVPLRAGGGMRVKILDAWCWGVPVVSTSIGAEGIECRDREDILIADEPEELADAVIRVLEDPALGRRLRENGRQRVERQYDWRRGYGTWDEVYVDMTQRLRDGMAR